MDLLPLPAHEIECQEGATKAEMVKKLHAEVRDNLAKRAEHYTRQANKHRKAMIFNPGDWVWLHLRPERFPQRRKDKLSSRGDGPFQVIERINDNAYRLELPGTYNTSTSFNVTDLVPYDIGDEEEVLRSEPSEGGGNDETRPAGQPADSSRYEGQDAGRDAGRRDEVRDEGRDSLNRTTREAVQAPRIDPGVSTRSRTKAQERCNMFTDQFLKLHDPRSCNLAGRDLHSEVVRSVFTITR